MASEIGTTGPQHKLNSTVASAISQKLPPVKK
ncbi:Uncharacterised protein [Vibrio cholerae]|nr:Uncharacterised protein [Vibrio cholerae]